MLSEVRLEGRSSRSSVQQALICFCKLSPFRESLFFSKGVGEHEKTQLLFSEPAAVSGGYLPLEKEYILLPEGKRPKELMDALKKQATEGPLSSYLSAPILPKTYETNADGRVYLVEWDDRLLILLTDPTGDDLLVVNLFSLSGNTNSMCVHLYSLYASVAGIEAEDILLIAAFVGGDGTWDDMSRLTPYCVVNEVQLQCSFADMGNGQVLPEAEICGAKGKE